MTRDELTAQMLALAEVTEVTQPMDPDALAEVLLLELAESWDSLPESTRAVVMGVATDLKRYGADEAFADLHATALMRDLRAG